MTEIETETGVITEYDSAQVVYHIWEPQWGLRIYFRRDDWQYDWQIIKQHRNYARSWYYVAGEMTKFESHAQLDPMGQA